MGNSSSEVGQNVLLRAKTMKTIPFCLSMTFLLLFASCNQELDPIDYGKDDCHWCQMRIMDPKFGSEAITDKGRTYKFDSAECLLHYINDTDTEHEHLVVTNFESPENFISAQSAWYLISKNMPSPMGGFLNAFESKSIAEKFQQENEGEILDWNQLKNKYSK